MTTARILGELDAHLIAEGTHYEIYRKLGAHSMRAGGVDGVAFAVWAPNARAVSVVGDFNGWNAAAHPLNVRADCGVWEGFVPGASAGDKYKYAIAARDGALLPFKADPFGFAAELRPATASIVWDLPQRLPRENGAAAAHAAPLRERPMAVYEAHLGSWKRRPEQGGRFLTYRELAHELVPYVKDMGFTHLEVLPISEHPFDGSWGYQPIGLFAPTSRFGTPDDFRYFVDAVHEAGLGLFIDWVAGHFPNDPHGLSHFDGTHLYDHEDPRQGWHPDWNTHIFNFGRREVVNYLISNALYWLGEYGIDGLRVDAVASMLYLDYSRAPGEWIPNQYGGRENLEAISFLRRLNEAAFGAFPQCTTIAEESTAWPGVSSPAYAGGLGFGFKWNMGWMHDTLEYMKADPLFRKYRHDELTFSLVYAFGENYVLPLSHDEVVHGKGSILQKMPGDRRQQFANVRLLYAYMYAHPGKKLLFMGNEFAQAAEWRHDFSLDWHLLDDPLHAGVARLVRDLNQLYTSMPALYELDASAEGFEWLNQDADASILAFSRRARDADDFVIAACNFTPVVRENYRIGVPAAGAYRELLNSDSSLYGGSNVGNLGGVRCENIPADGRTHSISVTLPPLGVVYLAPERSA
ncbi:MAG TPA: 1,4-alpha-glucan branching protein GlgB [Candidatus Baltobacteraceae bacterium]|nr:1,4-alpha-glucan branching protein GlgB [Candidatus Baltobacteraceae bacterium]